jgi:predicted phosphodiesterase
MVSKTIIIGDVHGCLTELEELLKITSYNKSSDSLIFLGDLIDRGPNSIGVIRKVQELKAACIMGNHEFNVYKWLSSNKSSKSKDYYPWLRDADINFIINMPLYIKKDNFIMVHAGLKNKIPLPLQAPNDVLYIRYIDKSGEMLTYKKLQKLSKKEIKDSFWTRYWTGPESIIYGHTIHSYKFPLIEDISPNVICYGLDTGCCFGGNLTALILETKEIFQVKAQQTYKLKFK